MGTNAAGDRLAAGVCDCSPLAMATRAAKASGGRGRQKESAQR